MSVSAFESDTTHPAWDHAFAALRDLSGHGAPLLGNIGGAVAAIGMAERLRRHAAVAVVDTMQAVDASRIHIDQGHASARAMVAHLAGIASGDAFRLDKIRRMVHGRADLVAGAWRVGELGIDQAFVLAKVYANPRVRERFLDDQAWFLDQATKDSWPRFQKRIARWVELADDDGPTPAPDPSQQRRNASVSQDHFAKAWHVRAQLGSLPGSRFNEVFGAYYDAETALDWQAARAEHGAGATRDQLPRTDDQRRADALCQMAEDAAANPNTSARTKRCHNLVWKGETAEELLRRWFGIKPRSIAIDDYGVADLDGNIVHAPSAIAHLVTDSFRRVVADPAGITIDLSHTARLFTGLARLGVELQTDECYWPGCHRPTTRCQIDHLRPAARGGPSDQDNGLPTCLRHNLIKEAGYTVTRRADGSIHITTPTGEIVR